MTERNFNQTGGVGCGCGPGVGVGCLIFPAAIAVTAAVIARVLRNRR